MTEGAWSGVGVLAKPEYADAILARQVGALERAVSALFIGIAGSAQDGAFAAAAVIGVTLRSVPAGRQQAPEAVSRRFRL